MRSFLLLIITLSYNSIALADNFPKQLVCQEINNETILPSTWSLLGEAKVKDLYKFIDGNLYISSAVQKEEHHGKLNRMVGLGLKYFVEYKTFVFSNAFKEATLVDHNRSVIKIAKLQCTKI